MSSAQEVIAQWQQAVQARDYWVEQERKLRDFIVSAAFKGHTQVAPTMADGTHRFDIGNGYSLKLAVVTKFEIKKGAEFAAWRDWLTKPGFMVPDKTETVQQSGQSVYDDVIRLKMELSKSRFDTIHPYIQKALEPALITKPMAPALSIEAVK